MKIMELQVLEKLQSKRMLVLGDLMLDRYVYGHVRRTSPEAPVLILETEQQEVHAGGAAAVAVQAASLGADVTIVGITGTDSDGQTLRRVLADGGVDTSLMLEDEQRPTTRKERFIGQASGKHGQQVLRVDQESREDIAGDLENRLCAVLGDVINDFDTLLISDYAKGVCTDRVTGVAMSAAGNVGCPTVVDPGRGRPVDYYRGATVLKPNRQEAAQLLRVQVNSPSAAMEAAVRLRQDCHVAQVVLTLDSDGCVHCDERGVRHVSTAARSVYDITGAGDTFLSVIGFCLANEIPMPHALPLANQASGLSVERTGSVVLTREELQRSLEQAQPVHDQSINPSGVVSISELEALVLRLKASGQRIVFTNGCFDLLHAGHLTCLREAATLGDVLIVAINSDASVRRQKGGTRPIVPEQDRASILGALACVDYVVVFKEDTPCDLLKRIRPDTLVKGGTYTPAGVVGADIVKTYGGVVHVTGCVPEMSTTETLRRVREQQSSIAAASDRD